MWCGGGLADLAAALLACDEWEPTVLHSRLQHLVPEPVLMDDVPFAQALPLVVDVEPNDYGITDAYIDDIPTFAPDLGENRHRASAATLLAMDVFERPVAEDEPIPRDDLASVNKLIAEGGLAEEMTLLGWRINTRSLLISLPDDKQVAWSNSIDELLTRGSARESELDTLIGRLNHVASIIPLTRHFLSRLRSLRERARHKRAIDIPVDIAADMTLWKDFLRSAHSGVNMNLLTPRAPTHEYFSDACEHGLGGFALHGRAWRLELPENLRGRLSLNMLEFIAAFVGPWIDIIEGNLPPLSCVLAHTDSTTADHWLHRSNFREFYKDGEEQQRETVAQISSKRNAARKFASLIMDSSVVLFSQWFPGKLNVEADSLSRDTHLSENKLTSLLRSSPSCQLPPGFKIQPLPNEVSSWIFSLAQTLPVVKRTCRILPRSELARGIDGSSSSDQSASDPTSTSKVSSHGRGTSSSGPSHMPCEAPLIRRPSTTNWLNQQSRMPSHMYARPSGRAVIQTLRGTSKDSLASFYNGSTEDTPTQIPARNPRRQ